MTSESNFLAVNFHTMFCKDVCVLEVNVANGAQDPVRDHVVLVILLCVLVKPILTTEDFCANTTRETFHFTFAAGLSLLLVTGLNVFVQCDKGGQVLITKVALFPSFCNKLGMLIIHVLRLILSIIL